MNLLEKGAIEIVPPAQSDSGFYSRYFLVPILDLRLLNYALMKRLFRMITLKQILLQICPGDGFMSLDLKDTYFHIQVAPPSQTILEIRIQRGGISIQGPAVWAIPGSPHFYTMHGCGSLPSATDGNPHTQLPRRLAHSGPVAGSFNIAQDPPSQPLRLPGAQGQLCQEHTVTQPTSFIPWLQLLTQCRWQQLSQRSEPWQFSTSRPPSSKVPPVRSKLSRECWPYGSGFAGTSVGSASHATHPVLAEAEGSMAAWRHGCHRVTVSRACVSALARWRDPFWLKQGMIVDTVHRRKVVMTDASNKGWEALCEGKPTFGLWSEKESDLHINCLEMLAVCQTFRFFLPDIRGHHVLIRSDSKSVVSYINHQGGLVSKRWRTTFLCGLRTSCAHWRWCMCRAKWTKEETCCQGTMSLRRNGHSTRSWLREFRKPLARLE